MFKILLDAYGADAGAQVVIDTALVALDKHKNIIAVASFLSIKFTIDIM